MTAVALALWVAGCAPVGDKDFWGTLPVDDVRPIVDDALGALARGDYDAAEVQVARALRAEPRNPYALLTAATLYQNTGRHARARQAYEEVLALPDPVPVKASLWGAAENSTAQDVARRGLLSLQDAAIAGVGPVGGGGPGRPMAAPATGGAFSMPLGVVPAMRADGAALGAAAEDGAEGAEAPGLDGRPEPETMRFEILRALRDEGLITQEEYYARRSANLGALLPLSQKPPAAGLDRPVTDAAAIADRLRQLRQAYEARYISAAQHAAERAIILDSLLPADPKARAPEARPPEDVVAVAAAVGRLERLREKALITSGEAAAERAKLQARLRALSPGAVSSAPAAAPAKGRPPTPPAKPTSAGANAPAGGAAPTSALVERGGDAMALAARAEQRPALLVPAAPEGDAGAFRASGETLGREGETLLPPMAGPAPMAPSSTNAAPAPAEVPAQASPPATEGPTQAVHLASFRSQAQAEEGWRVLAAKYPVLAGLSPRIVRVDLPGKGIFYRVHAAPLDDAAAAKRLCGQLSGQYCDPVVLGR